jgi:type I site-specific restriction endonuclease
LQCNFNISRVLTHWFFDEPVETIILNRTTKSLTLYYQMIGRGSKNYNKDTFSVIDLGTMQRFGLWSEPVNWRHL